MSHLLTVSDAIASHARLQPNKIGTRDSRRDADLRRLERPRQPAGQRPARRWGSSKGDRVVLLAYNCVEWMEIYVALARAGLVAVPVNFRLTAPEIAYIASHSEARAIIVQDDLRDRVEALRADSADRRELLDPLRRRARPPAGRATKR